MGNTIIEKGNSLLDVTVDGINSITCLPTRSCLQGNKNLDLSKQNIPESHCDTDRVENNLFEIIREQQILLDTDATIDP